MRVLRAKHVRKHLRFYKIVFGINDNPYHIILDGNFIFKALKLKIDVRNRLETLLQGSSIKLYVMRSIIKEMEQIGEKAQSAIKFATSLCEVIEDDKILGITPIDKIIKFLEKQGGSSIKMTVKDKKYFVATQDKELRQILGSRTGIPLIYLNNVTFVLEPPSNNSKDANKHMEVLKDSLNEEEQTNLNMIKSSISNVISPSTTNLFKDEDNNKTILLSKPLERKKRKATSPNPLSQLDPKTDSLNSKKRKRNKYKA